MTDTEYTPSDQDIEEFYALGRIEYSPGSDITPDSARDELRTWLARVRQEAAQEALAQEPTEAEAEAKIQADTDSLAAEIHEAVEFQYDQCDHGTYHGGHMHGEPYQMCRINAERIVRRRNARRDEEKR